jgi:anthranilate synthase component 1
MRRAFRVNPMPAANLRQTLTRELPGDLDTPVGLYYTLANAPYSYVLESMQGGEQWGRYSFVGLPCQEVIRVTGKHLQHLRGEEVLFSGEFDNPLPWLRAFVQARQTAPLPHLPRFAGGLVGYLGYDCVRYFEPRLQASTPPDALGVPDILLMVSDELLVFDNQRATLTLVVHHDHTPEGRQHAEKRLDVLEAELASARPLSRKGFDDSALPFTSSFGESAFKAGIERIKGYIAAGDVMQVVPSQRMSAPFTGDPLRLYRAIRRLNPSPYLYGLNLGDHHVVGSSPEILVRCEEGKVTVRPIAGTRPRGKSIEEDKALAADLLKDPKEVAEHLMLIDLGRNDIGRVAEVGSVKLTDKMTIEKYSHVMHIVSNVTGQLKAGLDAWDALAATFPAGTLSGAPKVRAMEIIDELEPHKRGIYGGAVGYVSWEGNMDFAIAIRTAVLKDGQMHVQAGCGVVADSDPDSEWLETLNKARAMIKAAEMVS